MGHLHSSATREHLGQAYPTTKGESIQQQQKASQPNYWQVYFQEQKGRLPKNNIPGGWRGHQSARDPSNTQHQRAVRHAGLGPPVH